MTPITRPLARESSAALYSAGRRRPVVIELQPDGPGSIGAGFIGFRLKGTRRTYYLPIDWAFREAVRAEIPRQKAERRKARKEKRS